MNAAYGIAILLLIGLWAFVRRREAKANEASKTPARVRIRSQAEVAQKSTPYHAVSIAFAAGACAAAKALEDERFLSGAAPRLPLPDCVAVECQCRFLHHSDRRRGSDRRAEFPRGFGGVDTGKFEVDRRERSDRRKDVEEDLL